MFSIDSIDSMINSSTNTKLHRFNYTERGLGCIKMSDLVRIHVNDLDTQFDTDYHLDAIDFLKNV